ncbi:hypothetical protein QZH41_009223 [Actinostola sp. cb2023]|nr:hypothetical protein QZH41_009223 [Actinostola sp. cb2023]
MADEIQVEKTSQPTETQSKHPENMASGQQDTKLNNIQGMYEDVQNCVKSIFEVGTSSSFENAAASFSEHQWQGLEQVCRLALLTKYPKYGTEGFTALYTRPPVIYVSTACAPGLGQYLCSQLGLPQSSICKVPCNTVFGSNHTLDIAAFERLFNDDVACGKTPLLLLAYAGTPLAGHTDNLGRLRELCTQNGLWLHIEGDNLAALTLPTVPPSLKAASSCDSMSLHISKWFGLPGGVSFCVSLVHSTCNPLTVSQYRAASAGLTRPALPERLSILPLWTSIQNIGLEKMKNMVLNAAQLAQQLCLGIDGIPSMKRIAQSHCTSLGVVFKYRASSSRSSPAASTEDSQEESGGDDDQDGSDLKSSSQDSHSDNEDIPQSVQDAMNTKLTDHLAQVAPSVVLDVVNIPKQGIFLKFTPMLSSRGTAIILFFIYRTMYIDVISAMHHVSLALQNICLPSIISKRVKYPIQCPFTERIIQGGSGKANMDALLVAQSAIKAALEGKDHVIMVDSHNPTVAGAILCFPPYWNHKTTEKLSEAKKMELNSLNKDVYSKVAEQHSDTFSPGLTDDGLSCINVHQVVSHPNKYAELVELVSKTCMELADSSKFLEQMQEMVRKGIEAAEEDLHKDAEERMLEDGLRQVPLVGSLYNWLSPPPKQSAVKGRTFNLSSG